jgi:UDP-N-acetylmuramyl pentapeptide phosphotransferase/UDP-N-acetylglucosamine-1-phosphate transferase
MLKTHRVGTITLGGLLVTFGVLFLLRLFLLNVSYEVIFRLWPIIFIFLGIEILIANFRQKGESLLYDKTAFALIIILSFFAMGMSIVDYIVTHIDANVASHIIY